jgi:hypothetical protein
VLGEEGSIDMHADDEPNEDSQGESDEEEEGFELAANQDEGISGEDSDSENDHTEEGH